MSKTRCTEVLMNEHKTILRALMVLDAMAESADGGGMPAKEDVRNILEFLKWFADDFHQGKEESILFPVFSRVCKQSGLSTVAHMIFEHNQERSLIEGLQDSLLTAKQKDFAYYANRLVAILGTHIYKEDHILFETIDTTLSPEDHDQVVAGYAEMDNAFRARVDASLRKLRELEWTYLRKSA